MKKYEADPQGGEHCEQLLTVCKGAVFLLRIGINHSFQMRSSAIFSSREPHALHFNEFILELQMTCTRIERPGPRCHGSVDVLQICLRAEFKWNLKKKIRRTCTGTLCNVLMMPLFLGFLFHLHLH